MAKLNRLTEFLSFYQEAVDNEASALMALERAREMQALYRSRLVDLIGEGTLETLLAKKEPTDV